MTSVESPNFVHLTVSYHNGAERTFPATGVSLLSNVLVFVHPTLGAEVVVPVSQIVAYWAKPAVDDHHDDHHDHDHEHGDVAGPGDDVPSNI